MIILLDTAVLHIYSISRRIIMLKTMFFFKFIIIWFKVIQFHLYNHNVLAFLFFSCKAGPAEANNMFIIFWAILLLKNSRICQLDPIVTMNILLPISWPNLVPVISGSWQKIITFLHPGSETTIDFEEYLWIWKSSYDTVWKDDKIIFNTS